MGDDLDGVVGVVVRGVAEEVERPTRAAGSPHLHTDGRESDHPSQHRADCGGAVGEKIGVTASRARRSEGLCDVLGDGIGRTGGVVARVLDHRRARGGGRAGLAVREPDRGGELDAVAHGDVVQTLLHRLVRVQTRVESRVLARREDLERHPSLDPWWCPSRSSRIPG